MKKPNYPIKRKNILVTGAAGFIGFHLCKQLINLGHNLIGLDNVNNYYSVQLKLDRLKCLGVDAVENNKLVTSTTYGNQFKFIKLNLEDREGLVKLFEHNQFDVVCNLAAQAGVRYSISITGLDSKSIASIINDCHGITIGISCPSFSTNFSTDEPFFARLLPH